MRRSSIASQATPVCTETSASRVPKTTVFPAKGTALVLNLLQLPKRGLQIGRGGKVPVCLHLVLLLANRLEQQGMSANVDMGLCNLPLAGRKLAPLHVKRSAPV